MAHKKAPEMYLYFVRSTIGGPVKIGVSKYPKTRLAQMQAVCPFPLEIIALIEAGFTKEREYHQAFAGVRLHGEWFEATDEILALADELGTCPVSPYEPVHKSANMSAEAIVKMREEGLKLQKIADCFQVSRQRIHQVLKENT